MRLRSEFDPSKDRCTEDLSFKEKSSLISLDVMEELNVSNLLIEWGFNNLVEVFRGKNSD